MSQGNDNNSGLSSWLTSLPAADWTPESCPSEADEQRESLPSEADETLEPHPSAPSIEPELAPEPICGLALKRKVDDLETDEIADNLSTRKRLCLSNLKQLERSMTPNKDGQVCPRYSLM